MNVSEKIERYKELFKEDPLYIELKRRNLLEVLFEPCLLYERVYFDSGYSTKQAGELLEIQGKEQTLINFLNRDDFKSYIQITRQGARGYYRYDYKSLFQFKMILMLLNLELSPSEIAIIIGSRSEYIEPNYGFYRTPSKSPVPMANEGLSEFIKEEIEKQIVEELSSFRQLEVLKDQRILELSLSNAQRALDTWESESRRITDDLENVEITISIHEMYLDTVINQEKKSFLGFLFNTKSKPAVEAGELEKKIDKLKEHRKKLLSRKEKLEEQKSQLSIEHKGAKEELEKFLENNPSLEINQQLDKPILKIEGD